METAQAHQRRTQEQKLGDLSDVRAGNHTGPSVSRPIALLLLNKQAVSTSFIQSLAQSAAAVCTLPCTFTLQDLAKQGYSNARRMRAQTWPESSPRGRS